MFLVSVFLLNLLHVLNILFVSLLTYVVRSLLF